MEQHSPISGYDRLTSLGERSYRWYRSPVSLNPQEKRYAMAFRTSAKPLLERRKNELKNGRRKSINVLPTVRWEKIDFIVRNKVYHSTLQAQQSKWRGKPGWCDAVNGLPALLGSSVPEACELLRLSRFPNSCTPCTTDIELYRNSCSIRELTLEMEEQKPFDKWIERNRLRDRFRSSIEQGFSGKHSIDKRRISQPTSLHFLRHFTMRLMM